MTKREAIQSFLNSGTIAVAGVSRDPRKFGSNAFRELRNKGYNVIPLNPALVDFEGNKCYASVDEIPGKIDALLMVIPPAESENLLKSLKRKDIKNVWLQPGTESGSILEYCRQADMNTVSGECILMHAKPHGLHSVHRFFRTIFGKMP